MDMTNHVKTNVEKEKTQKILGYFTEDQKPIFRNSRILSREEFEEFTKARYNIGEFHRNVLWFSIITKNHNRYNHTIGEAWKKFTLKGQPDFLGIDTININSVFNDWLTSITSFLNYMEYRLKNQDDRSLWEKFHSHTSEQYDKNVSYRFLYGLRNYIQHQAPPIHINYASRLENEKVVCNMSIFCSKKELLEDSKWNVKLREDIGKMDEIIEITPHVSSMMESLIQILRDYSQNEFLHLGKSATFIHNLIQSIPQGKDRGVYGIKLEGDKLVGITAYLMDADVAKAIVEGDVQQIIKMTQ